MELSQLLHNLNARWEILTGEWEALTDDIEHFSPNLAKLKRPHREVLSEEECSYAHNHTLYTQIGRLDELLDDYLEILCHQLAEPGSQDAKIYAMLKVIRAVHASIIVLDNENRCLQDALEHISQTIETMAKKLTGPQTNNLLGHIPTR